MSSKVKIQPIETTLSSVWMLQPEYTGLRQALESKGYTLRESARGSEPILATKGSIEIFANVQRRVIGIRSETSTKDLLIAYEDLEQIYMDLGIESSNLIFYEFVGSFSATSAKSPLETLKTLKIEQNILQKVGTIVDKDLATLGLNLTTSDGNPTSPEWLRLTIEPLYVSANKNYLLRTVYRGKKEDVVAFISKIEKRASKIIGKLEEG